MTVLLVHSSGFSPRQWRRLGERLAPTHRVLAPELLGYRGEPWRYPRPFHFREDVAHLAATLDEPAHVVGHSYGGLLALQLARAHPERVRSLALYEPVAFGVLEQDLDLLPRYQPDAAGLDEAWLATFVDWWNGAGAWGRMAPETQQAFKDVAWKMSQEVATLSADRTTRAEYGAIQVPTLLMAGRQTPEVEQRVVGALGEVLPRATVRWYDDLGHMGPITHSARINEAIVAHVEASAC